MCSDLSLGSVSCSIFVNLKHCGHRTIASDDRNTYNINVLGISLAVGRLTLDQLGQVRILDPQPTSPVFREAAMVLAGVTK